MKKYYSIIACLVAVGFAAAEVQAVNVNATITVDNAYGFGFGTSAGMTTYFGGLRNTTAAEIFNGLPVVYTAGDANVGNGYTNAGIGPESYNLTGLSVTDYLYVVAWSDDATFQGALASFQIGGTTVLTTGSIGWEVYATGIDRDSQIAADTLTIADLGLINTQIGIANSNSGVAGSTSIGWVDENGLLPNGSTGEGVLVFGETNTLGSFYAGTNTYIGTINGIDSNSQWMWYNEDPASIVNAFNNNVSPAGSDGHREFLIFRIPLASFANVPEPSSAILMLTASIGGLILPRRRRS